MRRFRLTFSVAGLCALAVLLTLAGPGKIAYADNNAATVLNDLSCVAAFDGWLAFGNGQCVNNSAGNTNCTCNATIVAGTVPSETQHFEGFGCGTPFGFTTDTKLVANPGGQVNFSCQIH